MFVPQVPVEVLSADMAPLKGIAAATVVVRRASVMFDISSVSACPEDSFAQFLPCVHAILKANAMMQKRVLLGQLLRTLSLARLLQLTHFH